MLSFFYKYSVCLLYRNASSISVTIHVTDLTSPKKKLLNLMLETMWSCCHTGQKKINCSLDSFNVSLLTTSRLTIFLIQHSLFFPYFRYYLLAYKKLVSSAKWWIVKCLNPFVTLSMYYKINKGPKEELCCTPHLRILVSDRKPEIKTYSFLCVIKEWNHLLSSPLTP